MFPGPDDPATHEAGRGAIGPGANSRAPPSTPPHHKYSPSASRVQDYFSGGRIIRSLFEALGCTDPAACLIATHEMAFLTNMLVAGCSLQSRAFTPDEASRAVIATCNLGLDVAQAGAGARHDMVAAFGAGWAALHEQVAMFAAGRLADMLAGVRSGDTRTHAALTALRRVLKTTREAGTPWLAREALDVLAILDVPTWTGLVGLIDECPTMPAVIEAVVTGRTGAISATDFEFISTRRQITCVQAFVGKLPQLLRD